MRLATEHFRRVRALETSKAAERHKWFIAAKQDKARRDARADEYEDALFDVAATTVLVDPADIEHFRSELDAYDEATVKALMQNRERLDELFLERDAMLEAAYQLDDGTRVFKSEDGTTVINEFGEVVPLEQIDPIQIQDHYPKAEPFLAILDSIDQHTQIEHGLLGYQKKLDDARERLNAGDMSQEEFAQTRQALKSEMPIQVRHHLPDEFNVNAVDLKTEFKPAANELPTASRTYTALPDFAMN